MQRYFIAAASGQEGPFSLEELKAKNISKDALVWKEGMPEWAKAEELTELKSFFAPVPPPLPKQSTSAAIAENKFFRERSVYQKKYKKLLPLAGVLIALIGVAIFYIERNSKKGVSEKHLLALSEPVKKEEAPAKKDTTNRKDTSFKKDTAKIINLDTLSNGLNWDTTKAKKKDTSVANTDTSSTLPPYFITTDKKKIQKGNLKKAKKTKEKQTQNQNNTQAEPEKINPAKYLEVSGSFRKNLLFETILEGTLYNRSSANSFSDVVIEVRFVDNNGRTIDSKQFTQPGILRQGQSISFKFKTQVSYKARSARYSIARAQING